jgi:hypothetical protein
MSGGKIPVHFFGIFFHQYNTILNLNYWINCCKQLFCITAEISLTVTAAFKLSALQN